MRRLGGPSKFRMPGNTIEVTARFTEKCSVLLRRKFPRVSIIKVRTKTQSEAVCALSLVASGATANLQFASAWPRGRALHGGLMVRNDMYHILKTRIALKMGERCNSPSLMASMWDASCMVCSRSAPSHHHQRQAWPDATMPRGRRSHPDFILKFNMNSNFAVPINFTVPLLARINLLVI